MKTPILETYVDRAKSNKISVIIAALNEEENLELTYKKIVEAIKGRFSEYEIIIFDDGSIDRTGKIADGIALRDKWVSVVHHKKPMNLGYVYRSGIMMASKEYVILVTGDNDVPQEALEDTFDLRGQADIVIPYHINPEIRPLTRRILSKGFVCLMNNLFSLKLRYYNGMVLHKTAVVNSISITTNSFAYQAEVLVKLLKKGHSYIEVGIELADRKKGKSKALKISNVVNVVKSILVLRKEIGQ